MIVDLTEDQARRALLKWRIAPPGVLPAWIAEMDYALAPPVHDALREAIEVGVTGYRTSTTTTRSVAPTPASPSASSATQSTRRTWSRPST